jgi:hypothetical protein
MDWQQALRTRLLGDGPLAALVSTRIDWNERPQGKVLPALTLQCVGDGREQHFKGFHSLQAARVQYDVWADSYATAAAIRDALIGEDVAPGAAVPAHTGNGHTFSRAMVELPPRDLTERVTVGDGQSKTIFRISMDLIHHHAPTEEGS